MIAPVPELPHWTDAQSVSTYITSILAFVVSVIAGLHPGFWEPAIAQALIPAVGLLVAGIAQAVNVATHRSAHGKVAAVVAVPPATVNVPVPGPQGEPGPQGAPAAAPDVDAVAESAARIVASRLGGVATLP
jgi:hypothetical protein